MINTLSKGGARWKYIFSSWLFAILTISLVLPANIGQPVVMSVISVILVQNYKQLLDERWVTWKVILGSMVSVGAIITLCTAPESIIRYVPLLLMLMLFPYHKVILFNTDKIQTIVLLIIVYIIVSQYFIAQGNPLFLWLRDFYLNSQSIDVVSSKEMDVFSFKYGEYRAGGVFFNPNVLAENLFAYYVIYSSVRKNIFLVLDLKYSLISFFVAFGLWFSGSRTYVIAFVLYLFLEFCLPVLKKIVLSGRVNFKQPLIFIVLFVFGMLFISIIYERFIQGFSHTGSASIKFFIFLNYIDNLMLRNDYVSFLFGGEHLVMFDADYGYLFGAFGFIGFIAIGYFYYSIGKEIPLARIASLCFIITSVGNSLLYSLPIACQMLLLLIVCAVQERKQLKLNPQLYARTNLQKTFENILL